MKHFTKFLGVFFVICFAIATNADEQRALSPLQPKPYSADKFWTAITLSGATHVEDALALLPPEYLRHYTLVYEGRGIQQASAANPRAILFGNNAHMILTFNGNPSDQGYNEIEMTEFNQKTSTWEYSFIQFPPDSSLGKPARSELNPRKCLLCHGENPRTIFKDYYSGWPGFYGGQGSIDPASQEMIDYRSYRKNAETNSRYSKLKTDFIWDKETGDTPSLAFNEPNNIYGKLLAHRQGIRVADDMWVQPQFKSKLYSFLAYLAADDCGWGIDSPNGIDPIGDLSKKLDTYTRQIILSRYPISRFSWSWETPAKIDYPIGAHYTLAYVSAGLFTDAMELATEISPDVGPGHPQFDDGIEDLIEHVNYRLRQRAAQVDPEFARRLVVETYLARVELKGLKSVYSDGSAEIFDNLLPMLNIRSNGINDGCEYLKQKALSEWP